MSLESNIAELVKSANGLTDAVHGKIGEIDQSVTKKINELETWRISAQGGYPAFNLLNNARLDKLNEDGTPKGFSIWNSECTVQLSVIEESKSVWWQVPGRVLRIVCEPKPEAARPYFSLWPGERGAMPSNAQPIKATRGFEYRVVSLAGGAEAYCGWESGRTELDLTQKDWTPVRLTTQGMQTTVLFSAYFLNKPINSRLVIELRNIFVNLGDAGFYSLGFSDLTDLTN